MLRLNIIGTRLACSSSKRSTVCFSEGNLIDWIQNLRVGVPFKDGSKQNLIRKLRSLYDSVLHFERYVLWWKLVFIYVFIFWFWEILNYGCSHSCVSSSFFFFPPGTFLETVGCFVHLRKCSGVECLVCSSSLHSQDYHFQEFSFSRSFLARVSLQCVSREIRCGNTKHGEQFFIHLITWF